MLLAAAFAPIVGALTPTAFVISQPLLALTLGWFAGVFLYLGASSLLPATHKARDARLLYLITLGGVTLIYGAQLLAH